MDVEPMHRYPEGATSPVVSNIMRVDIAIALVVGGLVHLQLYFDGYREIDKIGPSFLANAIGSGLIALAVLWRSEVLVRLAAAGLAAGTLVAFALTRRGDGFLDFREHGLNPSPQAIIALIAEIAVLLLVAASFVPAMRWPSGPAFGFRGALGAAAVVVAVAAGLGVKWSKDHDSASAAGPATPAGVTIKGFAFGPPTLTVKAGTTVTWTNADGVAHSVVAEDTSFISDDLPTGSTFEQTFDEDGTFAYFCGVHPSMTGTIEVTG